MTKFTIEAAAIEEAEFLAQDHNKPYSIALTGNEMEVMTKAHALSQRKFILETVNPCKLKPTA